jgi:predicted nucleotidyltransferase
LKDHQLTTAALSDIHQNIIATLAYFDVFNYPLTAGELYLFLNCKCDTEAFNATMFYLLLNDSVYRFDTFYTLKNDPAIAQRRREGNSKAEELIKTAHKVGGLLVRFPYVRGIAISGSLSKNFADDESDIDLFIITAKNRLWIARTFLHLFKKLTFLVKKEHFFCMNYFVDELGLEIVEKNIYTATEIVTLIPMEGDIAFGQFYSANAWTLNYLPNNYMRVSSARPLRNNFVKTFTELALNNKFGDLLNGALRKITAARWFKKTVQEKRNNRGVIMGMDAGQHYAKPDPKNFQQKLIARYQNRVNQLLHPSESDLARV